jgi:ubiquinol-cytochrome c reductase iron-sulfur subunit
MHESRDPLVELVADRRTLLAAAGIVGGTGLLLAAYPFFATLEPSAATQAESGPVETDIGGLLPGELTTVAWRGQPVWVMRRTADMVAALQRPDAQLADPQSRKSEQPRACANATRSTRPDVFVAIGICTHLGCTPTLRLDDPALNAEFNAPGAFVCPCHGSRFDLAGRVVRNVPAPSNLPIPPYSFAGTDLLRIG